MAPEQKQALVMCALAAVLFAILAAYQLARYGAAGSFAWAGFALVALMAGWQAYRLTRASPPR